MTMRTSLFNHRTIRQGAISAVGSVKIKLLLACCIGLTLFVLAGRTASFMGWKQHASSFHRSSLPGKGYALLINTWKRNDLLKKSISHYVSCPALASIRIVWSEPDPPSESLKKFLNHIIHLNGREIELKFDINKEDSLNNRFKEITDLKTDAVFSIDDDVIFPCTSLEFAFTVWQSAPDTMVGYVPRIHWVDKSKGNQDTYLYSGWWSVWWTGTYSMILSKAAFFHKKYLSMYTHEMPSSIREYVTKNRNCEDIAMSFLVANATGAPPIWVKGKIFEIGSTGISSLGGHSERRTHCVNWFASVYGRMPLVSTSVKAIDSRSSWFCFWSTIENLSRDCIHDPVLGEFKVARITKVIEKLRALEGMSFGKDFPIGVAVVGCGYFGVELAATISERLQNKGVVKAINVRKEILPNA